MVHEVRQIEGKVVEIGRLQDIFAEKILDQVEVLVFIEGGGAKTKKAENPLITLFSFHTSHY